MSRLVQIWWEPVRTAPHTLSVSHPPPPPQPYHVQTCPDLVRDSENCAPHSICMTPSPLSPPPPSLTMSRLVQIWWEPVRTAPHTLSVSSLPPYHLLPQPYHVQTWPDLVRANENWAPHSICITPRPLSLSTSWGTLHPSLPPLPSLPKSPSPQEYTSPSSVRARVWASRLPHATCTTLWLDKAFTYNVKIE